MIAKYFKIDLLGFIVAMIIGGIVIMVAHTVYDIYKITLPASSWFKVEELKIPNHVVGADPSIEYGRTITQKMSGQWSVETQQMRDGRWVTVCRAGDLSFYAPDESLPNPVKLDWFRGKCKAGAGTYRLQVTWLFSNTEGQTRSVLSESNVFKVTAR